MILGIDPGLANLGWAVIKSSSFQFSNTDRTSDFVLVNYGCVKTGKNEKPGKRLGKIYEEMEMLVKRFEIEKIGVEGVYFAKNAKSAMKVAEVIGVIRVCGWKLGVEVREVTPLQVKMALVGYGRAEKRQVEVMVRQELGIEEEIRPSHAADAAAVALAVGIGQKLIID